MNLENQEGKLPPQPKGKTTMTFRLMPNEKLAISAKAQELGMSPAQFAEALILNRYNDFNNQRTSLQGRTQSLVFEEDESLLFKKHLNILRHRFPNCTVEELLTATCIHAVENQGALWQRSMRTFLRRIKQKFYNQNSQS